jgi:cell division protein FtsW
MTGKVTSITEIRSAALKHEERTTATNRLVTTLLMVVAALVVIGLAATISASSAVALQETSDRWHYLRRQLVGLGMGSVALVVASRLPYRWYRKAAMPVFVATLALLGLVLTSFGQTAGGARSWLDLGPVNFQPSELAKFSVIIALAAVLERKYRTLTDLGHFLAPLAVYVGLVAFLIMRQPDLGAVLIIAAIALAVTVVSTAPIRYILATGVTGLGLGVLLVLVADYRIDRFLGFLDPWSDPGGNGWQVIQSYFALGTGGLFGSGLGMSRARWLYLPNAHTDFIFAILGEETGFIGGILVMILFALVAAIGWMVASRARDPFGRMVAVGLTTWITVQAVVNIGGVLGVLPITGVTLPFISYGGTSLAISLAVVGVLINIATSSDRGSRPGASRAAAEKPRSRGRSGRRAGGRTGRRSFRPSARPPARRPT